MPKVTILSSANLLAGIYSVAAVSIPKNIEYVKFGFDVTNMTDSTQTISIRTEISLDSGATWKPGPSSSFAGGPIKNLATRTPPFISTDEVILPRPDLSTRRIRGTITIMGAPRVQSVTLETR